jgi:hypothetical protein
MDKSRRYKNPGTEMLAEEKYSRRNSEMFKLLCNNWEASTEAGKGKNKNLRNQPPLLINVVLRMLLTKSDDVQWQIILH